MEATFTGKQSRKNDMAAGSNESQNPQVDADIPESCGPSDAVSSQGDDKDKKDRKSRQANKKEALFRKRQETRLPSLLLIIIRRFFPTLIENIKITVDPVDSRLKRLDLHISAGILAVVCHIESLRAINQVLDTPAAASAAAALLDLDPNSAGIYVAIPTACKATAIMNIFVD